MVSAAPIPGVTIVDPHLVRQDGWWRPGAVSPVLGASHGVWPFIARDIEGQPRKPRSDAGADEVSRATPLNKPLTPTDVGPFGKD
jgi:poly(beta-D-mannuronate) lyase